MSTANSTVAIAASAAQEPTKKEWNDLRPPVRDTDFKEKYPPDRELGTELGDAARVWKVYRGEAIEHDDALLKTWNDTVNILLTFAGLFSAAVTSFVIASADDLKPDPNAYVANVLITMFNATGGNDSPFAQFPAPPPIDAAPAPLSRVVNGLWFTSLFLSLAAALLCILVKQWLDEYTARTRASAKHHHQWAQRRSFYFQGLIDWNITAIISFLPLILHLALFLFLVGLTTFLWDLDSIIRWVMLSLVSVLLAFYVVLFFIPVWSAACPYATPLLAQLRNLGYSILIGICLLRRRAVACTAIIRRIIHFAFGVSPLSSQALDPDLVELGGMLPNDRRISSLREQRSRRPFERVLRKVAKTEDAAKIEGDFVAHLDCAALEWLVHDVSDSDALAVAWQSLGALLEEPKSRRFTCMLTVVPALVRDAGGEGGLWTALRSAGVLDDMQLGRMMRSALFLGSFVRNCSLSSIAYFAVPFSDLSYIRDTRSSDVALIYGHAKPRHSVVEAMNRIHGRGGPPPLSSTAIHLLYALEQLPDELYSNPEAVGGLLQYSDHARFPWTVWARIAHILGCPFKSQQSMHVCSAYCVVSALCDHVLQLREVDRSGPSMASHISVIPSPSNIHSFMQLIIDIISSGASSSTSLSRSVWTVLTDQRFLSSCMEQGVDITAHKWASALMFLVQHTVGPLYEPFVAEYTSSCCRLLSGCTSYHPLRILDNHIRFPPSDSEDALRALSLAWKRVLLWAVKITDPSRRFSALRSVVALAETFSIAYCSVDRNLQSWKATIDIFIRSSSTSLLAFFPTNVPGLTKEDRSEWISLFTSTMQHLLVLDPRVWQNLIHEVQTSGEQDVKELFTEVHTRLRDAGPCRKGACAGQEREGVYWLPAVGPVSQDEALNL